jgi:hypothetical protein
VAIAAVERAEGEKVKRQRRRRRRSPTAFDGGFELVEQLFAFVESLEVDDLEIIAVGGGREKGLVEGLSEQEELGGFGDRPEGGPDTFESPQVSEGHPLSNLGLAQRHDGALAGGWRIISGHDHIELALLPCACLGIRHKYRATLGFYSIILY